MNFEIEEAHASLLGALEKMLAQTSQDEHADGKRAYFSATLDTALEDAGFLDAIAMDDFGPVAAAMLVQQVAGTEAVTETAISAFLRPLLCPDWPRPVAVINGRADRPARFLAQARSVIFLDESSARICRLGDGDTVEADPFFAYPMARLADPEACRARSEAVNHDLAHRFLLLATACELGGVLQGALASVTDYVKNRQQFGRPIGSFQAVQHRLAAAASNVTAGIWLARKAAGDGEMGSALLATGYLQDCSPRIVYDLHQFMGAMGLTLEHPLYRWTYRARLLISELGGASNNLRAAAETQWA